MKSKIAQNKIAHIQEALASALNALPDVFSTVQWGGRAYKLPGPGSRGKKRPVLLTHVCITRQRDAISLGFRLEKSRARQIIRQHPWIKPHSFGKLKNTGWVEMEVQTMAQCKVVIALLRESRMLHPMPQPPETSGGPRSKPARSRKRGRVDKDDPVARRIDSVLSRKRDEGWRPAQVDAFDE